MLRVIFCAELACEYRENIAALGTFLQVPRFFISDRSFFLPFSSEVEQTLNSHLLVLNPANRTIIASRRYQAGLRRSIPVSRF